MTTAISEITGGYYLHPIVATTKINIMVANCSKQKNILFCQSSAEGTSDGSEWYFPPFYKH